MPVSGSTPTTRGKASKRSAVSRSMACGSIVLNSEPVFGLAASGSSRTTYGPNRPSLNKTSKPVSGSIPSTLSVTTGASTSSWAFAGVNSSGARPSGMFTMRRPLSSAPSAFGSPKISRYGPYCPVRSVIASVMASELIALGSWSRMWVAVNCRPSFSDAPK